MRFKTSEGTIAHLWKRCMRIKTSEGTIAHLWKRCMCIKTSEGTIAHLWKRCMCNKTSGGTIGDLWGTLHAKQNIYGHCIASLWNSCMYRDLATASGFP